MSCPLCGVARACERGQHESHLASLEESYAILGENQGAPGWCVLVLKEHLDHLAELPAARQLALWRDVARVAAAVRAVFGPVRLNYECLGNVVAHVHWHVIPRHADDPTPRQTVWGWSQDQLRGEMTPVQLGELRDQLRTAIARA